MAESKESSPFPQFDVQLTPNYGYVGTWQAAKALKEFFELQKALRFPALRTSISFGKTDTLRQKKKFKWAEGDYVAGEAIPFDGIPFIILDKNIYECEYGVDHKLRRKAKRGMKQESGEEDSEANSRSGGNGEKCKKRNCPAKIRMKEIMKFPDFQIDVDSRYKRNKVSDNLNASMEQGEVKGERRIYVYFPSDSEHKGHTIRTQVCATRQRIDGRIINLIDHLVEESEGSGLTSVEELSRQIDQYVQQTLQTDSSMHGHSLSRMSPEDEDIRYHREAAAIIHLFSRLQPGDLQDCVSRWSAEDSDQNIFFRNSSSDGKLLLVHQTSEQQKLMGQCENETCFVDSTCKTTRQSLPLLLLSVQGRMDRQIVASAILQEATGDQMREALEVVGSWNPSWRPASVMTERDDEDMAAVEDAFGGVPIILCDYHRATEWARWIDNPSNGVTEGWRAALAAGLEAISNARTEEDYCRLLGQLQGCRAWKDNERLRGWFGSRWLPHFEKWARAFLPSSRPSAVKRVLSLSSADQCPAEPKQGEALPDMLRDQCLQSLERLGVATRQAEERERLGHLLKCLGRAEQMYDSYAAAREKGEEGGGGRGSLKRQRLEVEPDVLEAGVVVPETVEIIYDIVNGEVSS